MSKHQRAMALRLSIFLALAMLGFVGCGQHGHRLQPPTGSGVTTDVAALAALTLDSPAPEGVDTKLWTDLTSALRAALARRNKAASGVPQAEESRIADFVIVADTGGVAQASWSFIFSVDYNHNGQVGTDDLVPIAMFYGADSSAGNWPSAKAVDGNHDNRVDLGDVTPLGMHYGEAVSGFELQTASAPEETAVWTALQQVPYNPHTLRATDGAVLFQTAVPGAQVGRFYRVMPYFAPPSGTASYGLPSNALRYYGGTAGAGSWPMGGHDPRRTFRGDAPGPSAPRMAWICNNAGAYSQYYAPALLLAKDGAVYVSDSRALAAIQPDGSLRWRRDLSAVDVSAGALGSDGSLYITRMTRTSFDSSYLEALSPGGTLLWSQQVGSKASQPLLTNERLYIETTGGLGCFSPSGEELWWLSPSIDPAVVEFAATQTTDDNIVFANGKKLFSLTPAGELAWNLELDYGTQGMLAAFSDGGLAAPTGAGIYAITNSGVMQWSELGFQCISNIALAADNSLRVITATQLAPFQYSLSALGRDGSTLFSVPLPEEFAAGKTVIDSQGYTYVIGFKNEHISGVANAYLIKCIDQVGAVLWETSIATSQYSITAAALGADGGLYIAGSSELLCLRDDGYAIPGPPVAGASAGAYCDHVNVRWTPLGHADSYRVYRDGEALPLAEVTVPQYDDYSVLDGNFHTYVVTGINVLGEGEPSLPAMGRIKIFVGGDTGPGDWAMQGHDAQHTYRSNIIGPSAAVLKWSYPAVGESLGGSGLYDSAVFGSENTTYLARGDGFLVALAPDGSEAWRIKLGNAASIPAIGADGTVYCVVHQSQVINNKTVLKFARVYAINPDRTVKWLYESPLTTVRNSTDAGVTIDSSGNIHCLLVTGELVVLSPSGDVLHQWPLDYYQQWPSAPVIGPEGNTYLYSINSGLYTSLYALDSTGAALWQIASHAGFSGSLLGAPTITPGGQIYAPGLKLLWLMPDGTCTPLDVSLLFSNLALAEDGRVFYASGSTSGLGWADSSGARHSFASAPTGSVSGLILDAAGKAYYVTRDTSAAKQNQVYCYSSTGAMLWSQPVGELNIYPGLALRDDGTLFVTTIDSLLAFADQ